jgi:polysaccharide pyruvyl transferase WcaK-like protein
VLQLFRSVAAEIVVAADERAADEDVQQYAAAADRVVRFPHHGDERHLAWAHDLCGEEWILRIDDDEVPSAGLLAALPELARDRSIDQVWLPTRWLTADPRAWLAEPPWWPDYHNRLLRRDARPWFSGVLHHGAEPGGSSRWLRDPIYHLDVALNGVSERRDKARRYLANSPGWQAYGGGDLSSTFYLPERRPHVRTEAVPLDDASLIDRVLAATPPPADRPRVRVEHVGRAEVDRTWPGREIGVSAYRASIDVVAAPTRLAAGSSTVVAVDVANGGDELWEAGLDRPPLIRVGHRWHAAETGAVEEGPRTPLPSRLVPGASTVVPIHVTAPTTPGPHQLEIGLVHEHVRWFGPPVSIEVDVTPGERGWSIAATDVAAPGDSRSRRWPLPRRTRGPLYLGWVGRGNLGDEAIHEVAQRELPGLRAVAVEGRLPTRGAAAVVLGGGTLIGHAEYRTALERVLQRHPGMALGALGTGVEDPAYRQEDADALHAELECWAPLLRQMAAPGVRGPRSRALLLDHGVDVPVTGDPALLLADGVPAPEHREPVLGINAGISWRMYGRDPELLIDQLATVASALADRGWRVRLISVWPPDVPYLRAIGSRAGIDAVDDCRGVDDLLAALGRCSVVAGMKLHSVVLASALMIPAVMLAYQPKCEDFMASLGRERLTVRTDEIIPAELIETIEALQADWRRERAGLQTAVDASRELTRAHFRRIRSLARGARGERVG